MTDYYTMLRKHLESSRSAAVSKCVPEDLSDNIIDLFNENLAMKIRYSDNSFNERDWAEIKQVVDLYESPLMRALR